MRVEGSAVVVGRPEWVDESVWGKWRGLDSGLPPYPLVRHLLDAAAMALFLWDEYLSHHQRACIAEGPGVGDELERARQLVGLGAGLRLPKPPRVYDPKGGRPPKHGPEFRFAKPETWPEPAVTTHTATADYGKAVTQAWDRVHPRLTHRAAWLDHEGELPLIEGTLIRLAVEHLSKDRAAPAVWLWSSKTGADDEDVDRGWRAFLRRFDLEHTFRLFKQTLGWARPRLREPEAADRWTWLIIAASTQLRLVRPVVRDLRHPWEKPAAPHRLTPARARRTFRNLRQHLPCPARAPKPHRPGPGRPPGTPKYPSGTSLRRGQNRRPG